MNPHTTLTRKQKKIVREKIREIESKAHTRIAVKIIRSHDGPLYEQAVKEFSNLRLHHAQHKTGVLILISLEDRRFQLLGDERIHEKMGEKGWNGLARILSESFGEGNYFEGLEKVLDDLEIELKTHFPKR